MSNISPESPRNLGLTILSALLSQTATPSNAASSESATGPNGAGRQGDQFSDSSSLSGSLPSGLAGSDGELFKALQALIKLIRGLRDEPESETDDNQFEQRLNQLGDLISRQIGPPAPSQNWTPPSGNAGQTPAQNSGQPGSGDAANKVSGNAPAKAGESSPGTTYNNSFGGNLRAMRDALQRQGATPEETKLALSIQAVESNDGISHDVSKDGLTDGARNFSPLNMNEDMLKRNGVEGDLTRLNTPRSPQDWDQVAQSYLQVKRNDADFINHLRNGYGGRQDTADYEQGLKKQAAIQEQKGLDHRDNHHVAHR